MYRQLKNSSNLSQLLTLAIIIFIFQYSSNVVAGNSCMKVEVTAQVQIIGPLIPGPNPIGIAAPIYTYEDGSVENALAMIYLVEPPKFTEDGTIHFTLDAAHDFNNTDSIVWRVDQVHSPTTNPGEYTINERLTILSGTGIYADAYGRGIGHGGSDFNTFTGYISGHARICDSL